jgi:hypothetical protein
MLTVRRLDTAEVSFADWRDFNKLGTAIVATIRSMPTTINNPAGKAAVSVHVPRPIALFKGEGILGTCPDPVNEPNWFGTCQFPRNVKINYCPGKTSRK